MKNTAAMVIVVGFVLAGLVAYSLISSPAATSEVQEVITIGSLPYDYSALVFIAEDQGFFAGNGLIATILTLNSTLDAAAKLENGEVDLSLLPEYSVVTEAFKKEKIAMLGSIDKYQSVSLVGRKDQGIEKVSDLKGKRIGATRGTVGEFYLARFLALHGMSLQDVALVDMRPPEYVDTLVNRGVDAIVTVYRYVAESQERLGNDVVVWPIQSSQMGFMLLTSRADWVAGHPGTITKLLKTMRQAEEYAVSQPAKAKAIVRKQMGYTDRDIETIWPDHQYSLSLDQSLIAAMEDEARWMIGNKLTTEKQVPSFLDYIHEGALKSVKPEAVSIIR